ncbi:MAG: 16S rRNA (adenine(1518)-N(6)/adenine(1519)-N(6))-dimethyltransferase RsmA [Dehalococcoidia bacterium]|nr:16S rRNA (adenine(1518)-N(6)/adenine(1519)-N(6))-dimethyltransferase RsmA [Dehalococcoidia bacterium]
MQGSAVPYESLMQQAKRMLGTMDIRAKKSLGQHFLVDSGALGKIVAVAELSAHDTVIEVGPGLGVLTAELVRQAGHVIAVELDDKLSLMLHSTFAKCANLRIVHDDILRCHPSSLLSQESKRYKVVSNLPYYITSAVIRHFLESECQPEFMVVMVQKEVARVITAQPSEMSLLSVAVQLYGEPRIVCSVPASSFYPPPKVDSAVLKIRVHAQPLIPRAGAPEFFTLARAGFVLTANSWLIHLRMV